MGRTGRSHNRFARTDRGSTLVEFALILPVIIILSFGTITAGMAYTRQLTISDATSQTARYAATLDRSAYASTDLFLDAVYARLMTVDDDELTTTATSRNICIAYVFVSSAGVSSTRSRTVTSTETATYSNTSCYTDNLPATGDRRIQISVSRGDTIDIVFRRFNVTLRRQVAVRYEVNA